MKKFNILSACLFLLVFAFAAPVFAQDTSGFSLIRDAEIESTLHDLADPIFIAAGLNPSSVKLILIKDSVLNAFVAGGMNIFLHTGLLNAADTPEQLVGVIAHETGHISGGHLARGSAAMKDASLEAIVSMVLGTAAAVLANNPQAGAAVVTGGQQIAQRSILSFSRAQESSADAAAMRFLDQARISSSGLQEFLEKLSGQELLPVDRQVEFVRTHPLTQDRIDAVRNHAVNSPYSGLKVTPPLEEKFERLKAKLLGYLQPEAALLRYGEKDPRISARYALAIAHYRKGNTDKALSLVSALIAQEPNNAYFYELKGQILFEEGKPKEAIAYYRKAIELQPKSGLLQAAYGHVLLEAQNNAYLDEAINQLSESLNTEPNQSSTWRFLATAWGRKKNDAMVAYCLAEEAQSRGDKRSARKLADRAIKLLPKGSPFAIKAQDIKQSKDDTDS